MAEVTTGVINISNRALLIIGAGVGDLFRGLHIITIIQVASTSIDNNLPGPHHRMFHMGKELIMEVHLQGMVEVSGKLEVNSSS